mgnify:CR=1 FL=1
MISVRIRLFYYHMKYFLESSFPEKQVFIVVQMHLGEIKIQGHTLHNYFTAFLEGSEETCKKRECDQHTEDSEKPCG